MITSTSCQCRKSGSDDVRSYIILGTASQRPRQAIDLSFLQRCHAQRLEGNGAMWRQGKEAPRLIPGTLRPWCGTGLHPLLEQALRRGAAEGEQVAAPVLGSSVPLIPQPVGQPCSARTSQERVARLFTPTTNSEIQSLVSSDMALQVENSTPDLS